MTVRSQWEFYSITGIDITTEFAGKAQNNTVLQYESLQTSTFLELLNLGDRPCRRSWIVLKCLAEALDSESKMNRQGSKITVTLGKKAFLFDPKVSSPRRYGGRPF